MAFNAFGLHLPDPNAMFLMFLFQNYYFILFVHSSYLLISANNFLLFMFLLKIYPSHSDFQM